MNVSIRPIALKDAAEYRRCWDTVAKEQRYFTEYKAAPLPAIQAQFRRALRDKTPFLVAVDGERVVGWAAVFRPSLTSVSHVGALGMGLLPDYREIGLGTKLAAGLLKMSRGKFDTLLLTVFGRNKRAQKLYQKMGFKLRGRIKKSVKLVYGFDDELIMQLQMRKR